MEADVVLDLTPQDGAMVWHFDRAPAPAGVLEQLDPNGEQRSPVAAGRSAPARCTAPTPEPDPDRHRRAGRRSRRPDGGPR